ncbi:MAG: type III secretion system export apparatus subunit SctV, partial [Pseudomonadota bacterium]
MKGFSPLMRVARMAVGRQDLLLVAMLALTVFMIILPMPTWLVDTLIGVNLAIVVLVLIVSVYLKDAVEFSTFPAVILLTTILRLALSISTTRLILTQADAGQIVETFGRFVVGGNLIVGIVIFLIITAVQFVVITKGSERVAEVAARFSLDALPGKQMAIDSDVRSGEIDMAEARRRRNVLQTESEFYGAMDGAMKFVKGDAIAGLIIIAVNIIGGLAVGVSQNGMELGAALALYSILTIGDGLVAQIPALLVAISSGTVVTRVASDETSDLGSGIATQLATKTRPLQVAGVVLACFALVPGFPMLVFLLLGGSFIALGFLLRQDGEEEADLDTGRDFQSEDDSEDVSPIVLRVAPDIATRISAAEFHTAARQERQLLYSDLGVAFPVFDLARGPLEEHRFQLVIDGVPIAQGEMPPDKLVVLDTLDHTTLVGVAGEETKPLWGDAPMVLAPVDARAKLEAASMPIQTIEHAMARFIAHRLPGQAGQFLGIQETRALLSGMEGVYGELVKEVQKHVPLPKLADVLRRLVEEQVSIRNLRIVLEALVEWGQKEKDPVLLAEYVRGALGRQICNRYA